MNISSGTHKSKSNMQKIIDYESEQRDRILKDRALLLDANVHRSYIYILKIHYDEECENKAYLSPYRWDFKVIDLDATHIPLVTYHTVNIMDLNSIRQYVDETQLSEATILKAQSEAQERRESYRETKKEKSLFLPQLLSGVLILLWFLLTLYR